jgi:hypothetical protein
MTISVKIDRGQGHDQGKLGPQTSLGQFLILCQEGIQGTLSYSNSSHLDAPAAVSCTELSMRILRDAGCTLGSESKWRRREKSLLLT